METILMFVGGLFLLWLFAGFLILLTMKIDIPPELPWPILIWGLVLAIVTLPYVAISMGRFPNGGGFVSREELEDWREGDPCPCSKCKRRRGEA